MHAQLRLPGYIPPGYSLWTVIQGAEAGGFGFIDTDDQYAATYLHGKLPQANATALTVFRGPPGATTLAATDARGGEHVALRRTTATAIYHDGMWFFGPGPEERVVRRWVFHWNRVAFHSLTFNVSSEIWGIRGPKSLAKEELIRIATSLVDRAAQPA